MVGILDSVDQRTQLVGENRLELLTFTLRGRQVYAINVFKVQEVVALPKITIIPQSHTVVIGVTYLRGHVIPVIDLSEAIGKRPLGVEGNRNIVVTEYNRTVQALLVSGVDRIVKLNWEEVLPPPAVSGRENFLTAITKIDDDIVEIIDVERVLAQIMPYDTSISDDIFDEELADKTEEYQMEVLLVDDSTTALKQAKETLEVLGLKVITETDGLKALGLLQKWRDEGIDLNKKLLMVITDAEMPEMDGYTLTAEIRSDPVLSSLFIVLHTSLSGAFNQAMIQKVGCDEFISKFQPNRLAEVVQSRIRQVVAERELSDQ